MGLMEKFKRIFKKQETKTLESKPVEIIPTACKYKNMIIEAPHKTIVEGSGKKFVIKAKDENNNPIANEEITIKVSDEILKLKTNEKGIIKLDPDFPVGKHRIVVTYPTGDYAQTILTTLFIRDSNYKSRKRKKEHSETHTSIYSQDMTMYIHNEGVYWVKLRDKKYQAIPDEEVIITIDNESHTVKTDERGIAKLEIKDLYQGKYTITSEFKGSDKYDPCSSKSKLQMLTRDIDREVIIEVKNLTMEFKVTKDKIDTLKEFLIRTIKRNKTHNEHMRILNNISFDVYKGDKLGILGFNGAGKSTLLKIMAGIYTPTSGSINAKGKIAPLLELGAGFDKNYTGKNNIYLNAALLSIDEKLINEKYDEIVEFSELGEFINYPIKNYSSGMRTKLGFSIATLINPDILIIDEILSVGDIKFKKKSADKINSMMKDGTTVLMVSHSISQIEQICDRCIWLENGEIKMDGDAEEVCEAYVQGAKRDMKKRKKAKGK